MIDSSRYEKIKICKLLLGLFCIGLGHILCIFNFFYNDMDIYLKIWQLGPDALKLLQIF